MHSFHRPNALRHLRDGTENLFLMHGRQMIAGPLFRPVMPLRDTRLNTPAEMLVRFIFAARFILFFCGLLAAVFAWRDGSVVGALQAVFCFATACAGHGWLKSRGKLEECDHAFETMMSGEVTPEEPTGLDALLERREALEQRRGQPGFDPWEVQAVRREINAYVREHPDSGRNVDPRR